MYLLLYLNVINSDVFTAELKLLASALCNKIMAGLVIMFSWSLVGVCFRNKWLDVTRKRT